jgi:hypothetical protein
VTNVAALDLDDTLLRSDYSLSPATRETLREWQASGRRIVIATGRPPRSVGGALPAELQSVPWICYNGAEICEQGRSVYRNLLSAHDTRRILRKLLKAMPAAVLGLEIDDVLYLNRPWQRPTAYELADLIEVADRPAAKILFFTDKAAGLADTFSDLPPSARVMVSDKYGLVQIMARTADKAQALRFLMARWGLTMQHVVAFGDDINDVDMVQHSGIGVAVENAIPEVKAVADRVTLSNDEDGVGAVLRDLLADAFSGDGCAGMV